VTRRAVVLAALLGLSAALAACSHATDPSPGAPRSLVVHGDTRLDGKRFDSEFVGAVVIDHGLVTPCQAELPPVRGGRYSIRVLGDGTGKGCGRTGATVVLWTFATDRILYSTNELAWPAEGDRIDFDAEYSTTAPNGAAPEVAQFNGTVFDSDGKVASVGTEVEAFVGHVRCGVASVRRSDDFVGYVVAVVGPDSVPGCMRDAPITFKVEGDVAKHDPVANRPPGVREAVDLRR
jgi:hypothetical protein